jgi:hypothetical protein
MKTVVLVWFFFFLKFLVLLTFVFVLGGVLRGILNVRIFFTFLYGFYFFFFFFFFCRSLFLFVSLFFSSRMYFSFGVQYCLSHITSSRFFFFSFSFSCSAAPIFVHGGLFAIRAVILA